MLHVRETFFPALVLTLSLALAPGCGGEGGLPSSAAADDGPIGAARAHALVEAGATLLDVRTDGEWAAGHLDGAVHLPVAELPARMAEIPRDRPVVVYCASGVRSASATATLREAGYEAHDLGGMGRWGR